WVDNLAPDAQRTLGAGAILATEFTVAELMGAAATEGPAAEDALDAAHQLGLVETDGMLYWFTHALVREELQHRLPASERARVHQRCVELESARAGADVTAWARAAEHILLSEGAVAERADERPGGRRAEILEAA